MIKKRFVSFFTSFALLALSVPATLADNPGNIVFVGDSITQGGQFLQGRVPSYRYQLFKNFVDNDIPYSPMGMTTGAARNVDVSALTPDYRGETFPNISEAAASGRAYQYSGHSGKGHYRADPGTAFPPANRGPVTLKLGQPNPFTKSKTTYFDGTAEKEYTGETYKSRHGSKKVDTLCVMIGINDLYDARESNDKIADHVQGIVKAYQKHNPKVRVYLFELLPTAANNGTGTNHKNNYGPYNEYLKSVAKKWSSGKSVVSVHDITQGFYAEDGSMVDGPSGAHPNAQGELIVAGNIARVLEVGQRNVGLKRIAHGELDKQPTLNPSLAGTSKQKWKLTAKKYLALNSPLNGGSDIRFDLGKSGKARTISLVAQMQETSDTEANRLGVLLGNGNDQVAQLYLGENGIFWQNGKTLLYGTKSEKAEDKLFTKKPAKIRIVWKPDSKNSASGGFYVWLGDQLIGERLQGTTDGNVVDAYKTKLLIGDIGNAFAVKATLLDLAFDDSAAYAPAAK